MTTQYTTLDVTLSATLTQELNQAQTYAYAVYVNVNGPKDPTNGYPLIWYTLADNGTLYQNGQSFQWTQNANATAQIPLNNPTNPTYSSGIVYIIVASNTDPNFTQDFQAAIAGSSGLSWTTAATCDYAYDPIEISVENLPGDSADKAPPDGSG